MNFNDLFFTLLLYRKAKTRQYRFYDCLVSHEGAYIDINRFVEPTDTITIAFKAYSTDMAARGDRPQHNTNQQWIMCARIDGQDHNSVMISPYWNWIEDNPDTPQSVNNTIIVDNGNGTDNRLFIADGWEKKLVITLPPNGTMTFYYVNEDIEKNIHRTPYAARSHDAEAQALLKLFAGFDYGDGSLCYNTAITRMYYFYIQDVNQQYTLRLQPAEDLSTGELGMYDTINNKFYSNKNNIGYFTVENNITDKIILDVESQIIDTSLYKVLCTSNVMPYKTSDNNLYLLRK